MADRARARDWARAHMFDIFEIRVPELSSPAISIWQRGSSFGLGDRRVLFVADTRLGSLGTARDRFRDVASATGGPDRGRWIVVSLREEANAAAAQDETWRAFLDALGRFLAGQPRWRVTCESDCDQHPLQRLQGVDAGGLLAHLDALRAAASYPVAFHAEI